VGAGIGVPLSFAGYYFATSLIFLAHPHYRFIILSIYSEGRSTKMKYHHPKYAWIEIPFVKTPILYTVESFQSELYEKKYERVDEIYKENQLIFIIYRGCLTIPNWKKKKGK
jgi:hypothetical protein